MAKDPPCQCSRGGFNPWVGKMPWKRKWQPIPVFLPGNTMDRRAWWATKRSQRVGHDLATKQQQQYIYWIPANINYWICPMTLFLLPPQGQEENSCLSFKRASLGDMNVEIYWTKTEESSSRNTPVLQQQLKHNVYKSLQALQINVLKHSHHKRQFSLLWNVIFCKWGIRNNKTSKSPLLYNPLFLMSS